MREKKTVADLRRLISKCKTFSSRFRLYLPSSKSACFRLFIYGNNATSMASEDISWMYHTVLGRFSANFSKKEYIKWYN